MISTYKVFFIEKPEPEVFSASNWTFEAITVRFFNSLGSLTREYPTEKILRIETDSAYYFFDNTKVVGRMLKDIN